MPDACFSHPRLARVYDPLDPDRSDLDAYIEVAEGFRSEVVLDVGCGTGALALRLVDLGICVLGIDPAAASVDIARSKVDSDLAEFVVAYASEIAADRAWARWTKESTWQRENIDGEGSVEQWVQTTDIDGEFVTFDSPTIFHSDGERINSTSTLRFRTEDALQRSLTVAGFEDIEVRDLPYAPGRGWMISARA